MEGTPGARLVVIYGEPICLGQPDWAETDPYPVAGAWDVQDSFGYRGYVWNDDRYVWTECPKCHRIGIEFEGRAGRLCDCFANDKVRNTRSPRLHEWWDCALWSGHGAAGRLALADGLVSADWLAVMVRQAPPGVVVLSACLSGTRDGALQSIAETLSYAGVNCVGMWVSVEDRAAVCYDVEFVRALVSGARVAEAHRVGMQQMALESPGMAGAAFLVPGVANGNARIYLEPGEIRKRLEVVGSAC